jgi:WD40 repeat protein
MHSSPVPSPICEKEGKKVMLTLSRSLGFLFLSLCGLVILLSFCVVPDTAAVSRRPPSAGTTFSTYAGHRNAVSAVAWSPDGKRMASASYDLTVQVWDPITGQRFFTYRGHTDWVTAVAWSPDGKELASGGPDSMV